MKRDLQAKFGIKQICPRNFSNEFEKRVWKKLRQCWYYHNAYCYDSSSTRYRTYGAVGWKVSDEWSCFNSSGLYNFYTWGKNHIKTEDDLKLYLDKDLLDNGLKLIRPESCRWVTNSENVRERNSRYIEQQREIMKEVGKRNKYKKGVPITEDMRKARSENMKKLNAKKDYKAQSKKVSEGLKRYYAEKKRKEQEANS